MQFWSSSDEEAGTEDLAAWLASIGSEGKEGTWEEGSAAAPTYDGGGEFGTALGDESAS